MGGIRFQDGFAYLLTQVFEQLSVLGFGYRIVSRSQQLDLTFFQHAFGVQLHSKVQAGLSAYRTNQTVGTFLSDDLCDVFQVQRLHKHLVSHGFVGHDRRGIGIYQNDFVTFLFQSYTRLSAGVVEFSRLPYYDRSGAYHHYLFNICSLWHAFCLRFHA